MLSVQCAKGVIGCKDNGSGKRGWNVVKDGAQSLDSIGDARGVAFLDMDEDVSTDFVL